MLLVTVDDIFINNNILFDNIYWVRLSDYLI